MIVRSLRWRLVFATALIIAAAIAASGVFTSLTVKREFDRFLLAQRLDDRRRAEQIVEGADRAALGDALRRVHAETGLQAVVVDQRGAIISRWPPELEKARIRLLPNGALAIDRRRNGVLESIRLRVRPHEIPGVGSVYFVPPPEIQSLARTTFGLRVDRWLVAGLALAALVAVIVTVSFFRRVFAPVEELTRGAQALSSGLLDTRVRVRGDDEIGRLARSFNAMAGALERNEQARRNMVSDIAHELRTPLSNIQVQIEAVQDGVLEPDANFFVSLAGDTSALAQLVDDLQQLSLAEVGQLRIDLAAVPVRELVQRIAPIAPSGVTIRLDIADDLVVRADPRRLAQVLRNLLSNAIRHAGTTVEVSAGRSGSSIDIRVRDDGPGVPPEHAPHVFERFHRADPSRSRTSGGAGLGLAIARALVELQGGTIRLDDGSLFVVTLPPA